LAAVVVAVVFTSIHLLAAAVPIAAPLSQRIVVRLYNLYGVADAELGQAETSAAAVLKTAGVDIVWRECVVKGRAPRANDGCADVLGSNEVIVRVLTTPAAIRGRELLGYSYVDGAAGRGVLSAVFADRVLRMAAQVDHSDERGRLMGRAIAHEIGHLLLGSTTHSSGGLMRARWLLREVEQNLVRDWRFSDAEASSMRVNAAARSLSGGAGILAGIAPDPNSHGVQAAP